MNPGSYEHEKYLKIEVGTTVPPFLKSAHIYPRKLTSLVEACYTVIEMIKCTNFVALQMYT